MFRFTIRRASARWRNKSKANNREERTRLFGRFPPVISSVPSLNFLSFASFHLLFFFCSINFLTVTSKISNIWRFYSDVYEPLALERLATHVENFFSQDSNIFAVSSIFKCNPGETNTISLLLLNHFYSSGISHRRVRKGKGSDELLLWSARPIASAKGFKHFLWISLFSAFRFIYSPPHSFRLITYYGFDTKKTSSPNFDACPRILFASSCFHFEFDILVTVRKQSVREQEKRRKLLFKRFCNISRWVLFPWMFFEWYSSFYLRFRRTSTRLRIFTTTLPDRWWSSVSLLLSVHHRERGVLTVRCRVPRCSYVEDLLQRSGKLTVQTCVDYRIVTNGGFGQ